MEGSSQLWSRYSSGLTAVKSKAASCERAYSSTERLASLVIATNTRKWLEMVWTPGNGMAKMVGNYFSRHVFTVLTAS